MPSLSRKPPNGKRTLLIQCGKNIPVFKTALKEKTYLLFTRYVFFLLHYLAQYAIILAFIDIFDSRCDTFLG